MNTYIIPVYNGASGVYVERVKAISLEDAKQKILDLYLDDDDSIPDDWNDFLMYMDEQYDYVFGEFYELSELE